MTNLRSQFARWRLRLVARSKAPVWRRGRQRHVVLLPRLLWGWALRRAPSDPAKDCEWAAIAASPGWSSIRSV
eukprot:6531807-Alexandrium_andersonii.AAC.1